MWQISSANPTRMSRTIMPTLIAESADSLGT